MLKQLECSWNFKNDFCMDSGNICQDAEDHNGGAVHGISSAFFRGGNPTFKSLYQGYCKPHLDRYCTSTGSSLGPLRSNGTSSRSIRPFLNFEKVKRST